nr:MAG TPA: hypothetical protein [Crassvirales sp.]
MDSKILIRFNHQFLILPSSRLLPLVKIRALQQHFQTLMVVLILLLL